VKKQKRAAPAAATSRCLNPACGKLYAPGHYGKLQKVCGGSYTERCSKKCPGSTCKKCGGDGVFKSSCSAWYRKYWSQVRKPPRGMSDEDRNRAVSHMEKRDVRFWALLVAAASSALRKGELLGITWADVEDGKEIRSNFPLSGQWDDRHGFVRTKTDTGRIAFLLQEVRKALTKLRQGEAKKDKPSDRIWPYSEVDTWKRWTNMQKKLKIANPDTKRPYRFHDLRHTAALRTLKRTGKLSDASTLCGHRNPATTAIYTQQRPEDFVKSLEG
jgi:integrase